MRKDVREDLEKARSEAASIRSEMERTRREINTEMTAARKEIGREVDQLKKEVDNKIQKAIDNPLAK
jgi:F0F1-type ATP synthase membrane subunit b/b'